MNSNGPMSSELAKLNHDVQDEHKETRDGVIGDGQELSEEDESRINDEVEDVNDGCMKVVQVQALVWPARQQQHPQGPLVRWEKFLPLRSLKVLLVENDDSTRHVVTALLRNCGYEVTAVANGLQAWKILEDLTKHIDLVLTEVVMPCLSGIGLLCKIMNHKTCKNTPVIMMSSHDSMSIVFKCLSKGAVDFLLKPIRKNELKNLWQHVWRKCHSSSGSGSESGVWTQKPRKSKSAESDNTTGSNDEDDIGNTGLNARDGSDHGSGTQSSWTKRPIEVDSPKPMSPWEQVAAPADSSCAQVVHSTSEAFGNNWEPVTMLECEGQDDDHGNVVGKDLEIGVPRVPNLQPEHPSEKVVAFAAGNNGEKLPEINSKNNVEQIEKAQLEFINSDKPKGESRNQAADGMGVINNSTDPQIGSTVFDIPNSPSKVSNHKDKVVNETKVIPSLELRLKGLRDFGDTGTIAYDRNVLKHSDLSAFSRYNAVSTANQAPTGNVGSCSLLDNSSEAVKTGSLQNFLSNSISTPPIQHSNGSNNNNDVGSITNNAFTKPAVCSEKPKRKSTVKDPHPSSTFQAVQNGHMLVPQTTMQRKDDDAKTILTQGRDTKHQVQLEHHHHRYHYHHHHHHVHNMPQQQQQLTNHDDSLLKTMSAAAPQCGSSNMLSRAIDGNVGNYSLNGSASGSEHGSSIALNPTEANIERNNGVAGKLRAGCGIRSIITIDQNRSAQREAALNKFRQKRKERCFDKKVNEIAFKLIKY
ncbi:hypothetical protein GH714_034655 [Hevea brasiliensis]|uniref:Response regulatory domain-containing protein n=1 Tax=Hevea brasiliensis TaxID=3981 RepID=A0A6A6L3E1_HEVBR|nr:hypothetical protein GH714_034655 [Hevea brasiliensis]